MDLSDICAFPIVYTLQKSAKQLKRIQLNQKYRSAISNLLCSETFQFCFSKLHVNVLVQLILSFHGADSRADRPRSVSDRGVRSHGVAPDRPEYRADPSSNMRWAGPMKNLVRYRAGPLSRRPTIRPIQYFARGNTYIEPEWERSDITYVNTIVLQ